MANKLYVVNGSHPCATVARALELKGIPYKVVEWPPPMHAPLQRMRFGNRTVPSMVFDDGEKLQGSRALLRRIEEMVPEPPLWPADADARAKVEAAEQWGDEVFQPIGRRLLWPAMKRRPSAMKSYTKDSKLPLPGFMVTASAPLISRIEIRMNDAGDDNARADLAAMPDHLDKIDGWIAEGVMGGEQPNAADLQIATTLRLLMTLGDLRPLIESRPAGQLALRLFPQGAGETPAGTLPADWLPAPINA